MEAIAATAPTNTITLTMEQWNALNQKLEYWVYGAIALIARELWEVFKGRGKKLSDIESTVKEIRALMATKEDAQEIARSEIKHYHEIQR